MLDLLPVIFRKLQSENYRQQLYQKVKTIFFFS